MMNYMEELASAWVGWLRHRKAVQEKVVELIRRTDAQFKDDEHLRSSSLQLLRESFYRVAIAEKLVESGKYNSFSHAKLLSLAQEIRDKRGHKGARSRDMRTADEERYYASARVRWSNLLKKADVRAADPRGGDTSSYRIGRA